jgi:phosphatidylglycerol:prolipoprotein diacylglycerol transferase
LYATARFILEFFRGDADRGFVIGWLSTSQFIALILAPLALALFIVRRRLLTGSAV